MSQQNSIVIQLIIYKWIKENDIESVIVQLNNEYGNVEEYIGRIRKEYDNKLLNVVDNSNSSIDVDKFGVFPVCLIRNLPKNYKNSIFYYNFTIFFITVILFITTLVIINTYS